jgi:hypothetical protein
MSFIHRPEPDSHLSLSFPALVVLSVEDGAIIMLKTESLSFRKRNSCLKSCGQGIRRVEPRFHNRRLRKRSLRICGLRQLKRPRDMYDSSGIGGAPLGICLAGPRKSLNLAENISPEASRSRGATVSAGSPNRAPKPSRAASAHSRAAIASLIQRHARESPQTDRRGRGRRLCRRSRC